MTEDFENTTPTNKLELAHDKELSNEEIYLLYLTLKKHDKSIITYLHADRHIEDIKNELEQIGRIENREGLYYPTKLSLLLLKNIQAKSTKKDTD